MAAERRYTRADLERVILGEEPRFNALEVAEKSQSDLEWTSRLWRALGFPELDDGEMLFTAGDTEAVITLTSMVKSGLVDLDTAVNMTRAVGQTMARLADWEIAAVLPTLPVAGEQSRLDLAVELLEDIGRPFEELLIYAWRRHLAAAVARVEALGATEDDLTTTEVTVGFADLVAFTELSNEIGEDRIGDLVEVFESRVHDVIAMHSGRAIKSLGDSVLFVNEDPVRALETAEDIVSVIGRDARLPDVRLGLASGSVVTRLGDVFGPPVNLAARLTAVARRNRVIIDQATAKMLPASKFETRKLPGRPLRGFGVVEPVTVRRH